MVGDSFDSQTHLALGLLGHEFCKCQFLHGGIGEDTGVGGLSAPLDHGRLQGDQKEPERETDP